ncbi:unnamed protein product, partial [marine sediment metagenome]
MDIEKDWFKVVITLGGVGWTLWMLFFRKNNEVFELMIKNQQTQLDKVEALLEKQDSRLDGTDLNLIKMETLFEGLAGKWDEMSIKYEAREEALVKSNQLKDDELKLKAAELATTKSLQEYQKTAFKASLDKMLEIQKG